MNEALKGLKGVKVEIPADEITRLNSLFPTEISKETLYKMEKLKEKTEGKKGLLVMQFPKKIMVDGEEEEEEEFTIATMREIMQKAANADDNLKPLQLSKHIHENFETKVWDGDLTVWTSACLKESKNKNYQDMLKHQTNILGAEYGIETDMILATALRYISGQEELMHQDFMQLNTQDTKGNPISINFNYDELFVDNHKNNANAHSETGIGASFRISSEGI